jgi:hypothetical protein
MLASFARTLPVAVALLAAALPASAGKRRGVTPSASQGARTALRQEGARAFRAGRYDEALEKFRAAADHDQDDPDTLADVALTLQKLGRTTEAIAANQNVVRLAAHPGATGDKVKRFEKLRLAAYFNLGRLGAAVAVPDIGACASLVAATDGCKPLLACREARQSNGSGLATVWEVLRIARTREAAILDEDDYHEVPPLIRGLTDAEYDSEAARPAIDLLPEQEGDTLLRYGTQEVGDECRRIYGDWSCDTSEEVRAETRRCQGTAAATGSGGAPSSSPGDGGVAACFRLSCDRAESAPWPAVQTEIDRRTQRLSSCHERLGQLDDTTCVVVYADSCNGHVGTYCTTTFHRTAKPRAEHHRVFELTAAQD